MHLKKILFGLFASFSLSCTQDFTVVDKEETYVIIDSFVQMEQIGSLDILVVLDRSGSMHDNEDEVGTGMELLRTDIGGLTGDYQFGFITTDGSNLGYVGPYDSSSSAIDLLLAPSLLPANAHGEAGFESTYVFLSSDEGIQFRRTEADFLLFLISDEEEQSSITTNIFYDWLQAEFSNVNHDVVSITTLESSTLCSAWEYGYKYEELANLYGKDAIDICSEDWAIWLSESSFLTRLKDYIELSHTPIASSIVVYVNHESIYGWSYDEETNTIYLDDTPDYGAVIEVGYDVVVE